MVHISKKRVADAIFTRINREFVEIFVAQTTKSETAALLNELFSTTEKIMLAKRLAIIFLLYNGCSSYEISQTLKVSPSTVLRIDAKRQFGRYSHIGKLLSRKSTRRTLLEFIELIITAGMPPRGRGRWSKTFREIHAWREGAK